MDIAFTSIFNSLSLVILIKNFYQFALILGKTLWDKLIAKDKIFEKTLWKIFIFVLFLIEQIYQKTNFIF